GGTAGGAGGGTAGGAGGGTAGGAGGGTAGGAGGGTAGGAGGGAAGGAGGGTAGGAGGGTAGGAGGGTAVDSGTSLYDGGVAVDGGAFTWNDDVAIYRGMNGTRISAVCDPAGTSVSVWGTDIYTDDSSVCTAGVHSGLIDFTTGGPLTVEIRPGEPAYLGTVRNGVTTFDYGSWSGSFVFVP
ncbi:MAG: protease, partial [Myxococcaceae bacterium]|nr:protease [Myxococcaceae bacterium]